MSRRVELKAATLLALTVACSMAFGVWDLTWYCDNEITPGSFILDSGGSPLAEGNMVYMLYTGPDGVANGLNPDGSLVDPLEYVLSLDPSVGGGYVTATIGETDFFPFNPQNAGEFNATSGMQDADGGLTVYAIAFDAPVVYGGGVFSGAGNWGASPSTWVLSGLHGDTVDVYGGGPWQTNNPFIPEPTTVGLMVAGLGGIAAYRRRRTAS